jgi:hypothetical protein
MAGFTSKTATGETATAGGTTGETTAVGPALPGSISPGEATSGRLLRILEGSPLSQLSTTVDCPDKVLSWKTGGCDSAWKVAESLPRSAEACGSEENGDARFEGNGPGSSSRIGASPDTVFPLEGCKEPVAGIS